MYDKEIKPQTWEELPNGKWLQDAIQDKLAAWWPQMFGYHLLSIGPLSAALDKKKMRISKEFTLYPKSDANILGSYKDLPILNGVIDAVVCSLLLDFEADPYRVLREADRVLISGGYLFIIGFNPLSPMMIGKLFPSYQQKLPWSGRFFTPYRVKDWLGLLGYQIVADERLGYHHLLCDVDAESIWQRALRSWLPGSGAIYILIARKLETPMTPIIERQKIRKAKWSTATSIGKIVPNESSNNKG